MSDTVSMVSFISTRELSKQPGKVMAKVSAEGTQVVTKNGVPAAYLIPTSSLGIEADLDALRRLMLGRALDTAQAEAARSGVSDTTMEAIDEEIAAYRKERRAMRVKEQPQ
jgi:prevent-host-death family protein